MLEPLKNKKKFRLLGESGGLDDMRADCHDDEDIKSAVEWMKSKMLEEGFDYPSHIIDEAFEDVK